MAGRDILRRLDRLENAQRPPGVRVAVVTDEADAAQVKQEHQAAGDRRTLVMVCTGVPRSAEAP